MNLPLLLLFTFFEDWSSLLIYSNTYSVPFLIFNPRDPILINPYLQATWM